MKNKYLYPASYITADNLIIFNSGTGYRMIFSAITDNDVWIGYETDFFPFFLWPPPKIRLTLDWLYKNNLAWKIVLSLVKLPLNVNLEIRYVKLLLQLYCLNHCGFWTTCFWNLPG